MKTLILTGWGHMDYACAAALALRVYDSKADILGMSMRRLPEFLNTEASGYQQIVILGIGLSGNPELLVAALKKLHTSKVKVSWISALPLPEYLQESDLKMEIHGYDNVDSLTAATALHFKISCDDLKPMLEESKSSRLAPRYRLLLDSAMYFYRNYQDMQPYELVIRHLAAGDDESRWQAPEQQRISHYLRYGNRELVGKSAAIYELQDRIKKVAPKDHARVIIFGESGTGKETIMQLIHNQSPRKDEPLIAFNCTTVNPALLESRLFGYDKGAFTGAMADTPGLFEQANGGTLFLDEIGELTMDVQGLLLRVLEGGRFMRVGGKREITVDVRLITATNRDLAGMVRNSKFREDLFHRLNVVQIRAAPLREHKEDIPSIANGYWLKACKSRLSPKQIDALMAYNYPGNVRELLNLLERALVLGETDFGALIEEHKQTTINIMPAPVTSYPDNLKQMTIQHVRHVYEKCGKNVSKAAQSLGVARNTVTGYILQR
ncbi:MAG: sigma-54 dependent transcriptional regulator [bacterium]